MSTTDLSKVYNPDAFVRLSIIRQEERNNFIGSGVAVSDGEIANRLSGGANLISLPRLLGVTNNEPNYSNDNPAVTSTPDNVDTRVQKARAAQRNKSWSVMDLARELTDADPVAAVTGTIGDYWATDDEQRLIRSAKGIRADNVTNDNSDMVASVVNDVAGTPTDAERINGNVILDAAQTLGDHKDKLTAIAIHSITHTRLRKLGLLKDHHDPQTGAILFTTYLNFRVIVDDSLPAVMGTNRIAYTSVLFGAGAVGFASGNVQTASALDRNEDAGNGGGESILYSRVNTCFHPYGFEFTDNSVAGQSPTYAELEAATNWNRVLTRKQVPMAFIETND